jgi:hypothetical protein
VNTGNIVLVCVLNASMGFMRIWGESSDEAMFVANIVCLVLTLACWVATQARH